jgi:RNA polymerase sigma-70 factor (ECF subfamily)
MTSSTEPDNALRGQRFREFVEPEIEVMLRVARTLTSSDADAEDLVQEALLRAFRAVDKFDGKYPRAWLLTIVRNTNANMHRRRRPTTIGDWEVLRTARPAFGDSSLPSAEDSYVAAALDGELAKAVLALDPRFRDVVVLVDIHDLTYAEAAAVLDLPVGTVMSRLSRARDRIRKQLGAPTVREGGRP